MRCFVLPSDCAGHGRHKLIGSSFHYLCRVRRYRTGATFPATDGAGTVYQCTIRAVARDFCIIEIVPEPDAAQATPDVAPTGSDAAQARHLPAARAVPRGERSVQITLYQALPKGRKLDQIIRQATEAGVSRIVPFTSRNCVADTPDPRRLNGKLDRWRAIAREAVQQSGRTAVPHIDVPISLQQISGVPSAAGASGSAVGLLFHQQPLAQQTLHEYLRPSPSSVLIVIGAEGGFTESEVEYLCSQRGFRPAYLGAAVLRTETASLYAVAAVQTILGEIEAWNRSWPT